MDEVLAGQSSSDRLSGDVIALRLWYESHREPLTRFACFLTGDWASAEDLVHEAFVRMFQRPRAIHRDGFNAYARQTILNLAKRQRWRAARERRYLNARGPALVAPDAAASARAPSLWAALSTLSTQQRACVVLRFYEDLTEREIARILGIGPGSVRKHLSRALTTLRETIGRQS